MAPRGQGYNTPTRPIRVDLDLWEEFGAAAKLLDADRSTLLREFMEWVVRRPKARAPRRPSTGVSGAEGRTEGE